MVHSDHLGRDDLVRRVIALVLDLAIVLEAIGVALILFALTRDDLVRRYPWLG